MYTCLCHAVNERTVRAAARAGRCTPDDVMCKTRAGTCCKTCVPDIERIVREELERRSPDAIAAK